MRSTKQKPGKIELYTDKAGETRWRVIARNGQNRANCGEGYTRKDDARDALEGTVQALLAMVGYRQSKETIGLLLVPHVVDLTRPRSRKAAKRVAKK